MTAPKTMVCRCEDLTLHDVEGAIEEGYDCFEDLKRFLGVGTGPCQGKSCVATCTRLLADRASIDPADIDVMTFRPPVRPIPFDLLAADDEGSC